MAESIDPGFGLSQIAVVRGDRDVAVSQTSFTLEAANDNVQAWLLKRELDLAQEGFEDAKASLQDAFGLIKINVVARTGRSLAFLCLNE